MKKVVKQCEKNNKITEKNHPGIHEKSRSG